MGIDRLALAKNRIEARCRIHVDLSQLVARLVVYSIRVLIGAYSIATH